MTSKNFLKSEASLSSFSKIQQDLAQSGKMVRTQNSIIFFGQSGLNLEGLQDLITKTQVLNQVHGIEIILSGSQSKTADGHWSEKKNEALVIKTADCMPVFIEDDHRVIALHIGWRGLAQKFLTHAFHLIKKPATSRLWVGPHIQQSHFELDTDSTKMILTPHKIDLKKALHLGLIKTSVAQRNHYNVNLSAVLKSEAQSLGLSKIEISTINTFTSDLHYSHRRNRNQLNRNLSFIMRI